MKLTTKGVVALAATMALGLAACQPSESGGPGGEESQGPTTTNTGLAGEAAQINEQPRDNIKDGGTLTTAVPEISAQFNTFQADGTLYTLQVWQWYNPQLATYTPEGEWSFNEDYLTDVQGETKDGKTVVTYTIRDEATFNDGTPIDVKAFEATWKAQSGKDKAYETSSTDGYDKITSVEAGENDKQVVVTWGEPWPWWKGQFNQILHPKAAVDAETYNTAYVENPHNEWGAGPYQVKSYDAKGGTIVFERNPKWWGDKGKLDQRIYKAMESTASLNAFRNGELDATGVASKERYTQVKDMEGIEIRRSATPSNGLLMLNADSTLLGDQSVRQALFKGVDRETLLQVEFQGLNYTEELPGSFMLFPWQEGYEDNVTAAGIAYDAEGAKKLLDEAGWTMGDGEFREKDGKTLDLKFAVIGDSPTTKARAAALQKMMKDIGVKLTLDNKPSSEFSATFTGKKWDFFVLGFSSSDPFGQAYFCQLYCDPSGLNLSGTGSEEFNAKIKKATAIADEAEQTAELNKLEVEAFGFAGILPLNNGPTMVAVKKGLANYGAGLFYVGKPQDIGWQK